MGPAGVGKTTLARDAVDATGRSALWVVGSESARSVPLGAFADLVALDGPIEPATVLRAARAQLLSGTGPEIIGVDDGHLLDSFSATLVHQLALSGSVQLVVTLRDGEQPPDAITALWKDEWLTRVDLGAFTRDQTAEVIEGALDGPVGVPSVDRMFRASDGNPLFLRHLVEDAIDAGHFHERSGIWQLRVESVAIGEKLDAIVASRLARLTAQERHVLEILSLAEPIDVRVLTELTSVDAVEGAERAGMVRVQEHGSSIVVRLDHPLYGEVLAGRFAAHDARRIRGEIVRKMSDPEPAKLVDRIRLASLSLDSDTPADPARLVDAARDALRLGDIELCEQLARGAQATGQGGFFASIYLCHAMSWQGRGAEVERELVQFDPDELDEFQLLHWGLSRAANSFWMLSRPDDARGLLDLLTARATQPFVLDLVAALDAMFRLYADESDAAIDTAEQVLASPDAVPLARAWAAAADVLGRAATGRFEGMDEVARDGQEAAHAAETGLLGFTMGYGLIIARTLSGDLAGARAVGDEYVESAELQEPARSLAGIMLGRALFGHGKLLDASAELRHAAAALEGTGLAWEMLAPTYLAMAAAALGDIKDARNSLDRAELVFGEKCAFHYPDLLMARAWVAAAEHDAERARSHARAAAAAAERTGQRTSAAFALVTAVQFGDDSVADDMARIADEVPTPVTAAFARLAHGVADADGERIDSAAQELERLGMALVAADAYGLAATEHARAGRRTVVAAATASARRLAADCGGADTPALALTPRAVPLTAREHEVALMVATGESNRAIAERLVVSIRTVEGHIYRACTKLGVPDRAALTTVMRAELE